MTQPLIELKGICKSFGQTVVLDRIDLMLNRGEALAVIGPSGTRKSTILRIVAGLLVPDAGEVYIQGQRREGWIENIEIQPKPTGVALTVEIAPADLLIPRNTWIEATQAGLIGETSIDMTPQQNLPTGVAIAKPLERNCNPAIIICNGSRLRGHAKLDVDALIRSLLKISDLLTAPEFTAMIASFMEKASNALVSIDGLSREVSVLSKDVRQRLGVGTLDTTLKEIGLTAKEFRLTARQINELVAANRGTLVATLDSLKQTSDRMRVAVDSLAPVINQVGQSELLQNLNALSANAANVMFT